MPFDPSKLTPAPCWEVYHRHVDAKDDSDEISGLGWELDGPPEPQLRGMFAKAADAHFVVLARRAFDVMTRRGWGVRQRIAEEGGWVIAANAVLPTRLIHLHWPDPFTALVEADRWYAENVEKAQPR